MSKLLFLGTAQDGGVPQVGCNCKNCSSVKRSASSIALIDSNDVVLIDVSPDYRQQYRMLYELLSEVNLKAIYLTHAHWGHYGGLMLLGKECWNIRNLPVYLSQQFYNFLISNDPFASLFSDNHLIPHIIKDNCNTEHGITPHQVIHRNEYSDTFAFTFDLNGKKTLYMPDIDGLSTECDQLIRSMDLSIIDATFYNSSELPHRNISNIPHPLVQESVKLFSSMAERVVFTHFNHTNSILNIRGNITSQIQRLGYRIADDGMILT
jgi:pyrroloquinoline quinone biosynthesis protein B